MLRSTKSTYGWMAIGLHWLMAILLAGQFGLGLLMTRLEDQRRAFELIQWHKTTGFLLLALAALRILWRLTNKPPPPPPSLAIPFRRGAALVHGALYGLMLALPLSGWALVSASVLAIPTVLFGTTVIPNLPVSVSEVSETFWNSAHWLLALALASLVILHVAASLWHVLTLPEPFLQRILRPDGQKPQ